MKFTSEDLLKAMGLKQNDTIKIECGDVFKVVLTPMHINHDGITYTQDTYELEFINSTIRMPIMILLNNNYTIIQPKPTLTEDEKVILKNINKEYRWIARNESKECVSVFSDFPTRASFVWDYCDAMWNLPFNHLFQFIKWEDEPYEIKELLK